MESQDERPSSSTRFPRFAPTLHYLTRGEAKPYSYTHEPPPGVSGPVGNGRFRRGHRDPRRTADSVRPVAGRTGLRTGPASHQGARLLFAGRGCFGLLPEIEILLKQVTGAEKVVIFDHTVRSIARLGQPGMREPVLRVHNDYTLTSGPRRVRDHLPPDEAARRLGARFAEVNVWRPINGPIESQPLAVCDARTIAPEDFIPSDLIYPIAWARPTPSPTTRPTAVLRATDGAHGSLAHQGL